MLFVLFAFIVPSIFCAFLGLYLCIHHRAKPINTFDLESILLLQQHEKASFSQTPLLLHNGLANNKKYLFYLKITFVSLIERPGILCSKVFILFSSTVAAPILENSKSLGGS